MTSKEKEVRLSEEERKFLFLCLKSKNTFTLKRTVMIERILTKFKMLINF